MGRMSFPPPTQTTVLQGHLLNGAAKGLTAAKEHSGAAMLSSAAKRLTGAGKGLNGSAKFF